MSNKLRISLLVGLIAFLLSCILVACRQPAVEAPATEKAVLPIEVMDQVGRLVKVSKIPEKIIANL